MGTVIGWSSPAEALVTNDVGLSTEEFTWISSIMPVGAAFGCLFVAAVQDRIGRKWTMIVLAPIFCISWALLGLANGFVVFIIGRLLTGFCGGGYCVVAPTYTAEISEKTIRGALGVMFQFLLVIGILFSYAFGEFNNLKALSFPCACVPIIMLVILLFLPESPVYYCKKGNMDECTKSLKFFRGPDYVLDAEIADMKEYTKVEGEIMEFLKLKSTIKACLMLLGAHIIQQLSGINSIMFFAHKIFKMAGSTMSPGLCAVILGIVQVIATGVAAGTVDRAGRKLLFIISLAVMCVCFVFLGIFFLIQENNEEQAKKIGWLPLTSVCLYMLGFSLGTGPLPWALLGEMIPNRIKSVVASAISALNWLLAFAVTCSFPALVETLNAAPVFWGYAVICALGVAFEALFVIETKNKTLEEIQKELAG